MAGNNLAFGKSNKDTAQRNQGHPRNYQLEASRRATFVQQNQASQRGNNDI